MKVFIPISQLCPKTSQGDIIMQLVKLHKSNIRICMIRASEFSTSWFCLTIFNPPVFFGSLFPAPAIPEPIIFVRSNIAPIIPPPIIHSFINNSHIGYLRISNPCIKNPPENISPGDPFNSSKRLL
ncbi:MAG: hypothetical protein K6E33_09700 [Lachnospiraceae bacterium]|nr:hypothetical protein [Lachnospiraceae bacterium]